MSLRLNGQAMLPIMFYMTVKVIAGLIRTWKWCGMKAIMTGMVLCSHENCVRITALMSAVLHKMAKPIISLLYLIWMIRGMLITNIINVIHSVPVSLPSWQTGWIWVEAWLIAIHVRISPVRLVLRYILTHWTLLGCVTKIILLGILLRRPGSVSMILVKIQWISLESIVWLILVTIGIIPTMMISIIKKVACWQPTILQVWICPSI